jgi:hypothetical protein
VLRSASGVVSGPAALLLGSWCGGAAPSASVVFNRVLDCLRQVAALAACGKGAAGGGERCQQRGDARGAQPGRPRLAGHKWKDMQCGGWGG